MLKRNKAISIVLAFVFCMTFLAPALIAPATAEASTTYNVLQAPTMKSAVGAQDLGVIKVTLPDTALFAYSKVTVSLPSDLTFPNNGGTVPVAGAPGTGITVVATGNNDCLGAGAFSGPFSLSGNNNFDIEMASAALINASANQNVDQFFYIYFNGINLNNYTGDIEVSFEAPSNSGFSSSGPLVIGKSTNSGSTTTTIKKVEDITDAGGLIDTITIAENCAQTLDLSKKIKLKVVTKGFTWDDNATPIATYEWAFGDDTAAKAVPINAATLSADEQTLEYDINTTSAMYNEAGKISFSGLRIDVNDSKANPGDEVEVKVSGADMDSEYIIVANFVDYDVVVEEGTTKTLVTGQNEQKIGEFYIKEGAFGSLVTNRIIKFTLPSGCEWFNTGDTEIINSSNIRFNGTPGYPVIDGDDNEILKYEVNASTNEGAEVKFKDFKINVSPDFTGDIELDVSGSAGAQGTITVAEVKPAATIAVDEVKEIILGKPDQKIADITLTEGDVEGFLEGDIVLILDEGYRFTQKPTVEVAEGDIDIDDNVTVNGNLLTIEVTGQSVKTASKILISDIYVDAYRTAPEGPVELEFGDLVNDGCSALNEVVSFNDKSPGKAVVANCVTAALGITMGNGQFVIGSNIYELNGVKKVMDASPYIKNDRTYVPVRFLGYVVGLTDDDIVWDQASQKVTMTKDDNVVELTIGSTTMYVNGEAVTMDVAPEITSDRTMLPARYVAEGFGYKVGWDNLTRTVLISK